MKFTLLAILLASTQAQASVFQLDQIAYAGKACDANAPVPFLVNANGAITIRAALQARAKSNGFERSACTIAVPVQLPPGQRLAVALVDANGMVQPNRGSAAFSTELFLAGSRNTPLTESYTGGRRHPVHKSARAIPVVRSACGGSASLRVNTNVLARNGGSIAITRQRARAWLEACDE